MNAALIRRLNVARVFHTLRLHPGASQREIAQRARLDKATVSAVVSELEREGLVARTVEAVEGRVGRPEVRHHIPDGAGTLVGARLEPASIRLIATDLTGRPRGHLQVPGTRDIELALRRLETGVRDLLVSCGVQLAAVKGLGVGVPALIGADGRLAFAPNLGWRDIELLADLRERFAVTVYVDNDTKAAGLAEKLFGSCQETQDFVLIAAHSGVGAALHLGGRLYRGQSGYAGEFGHVKVRPGGRRCGCGAAGCLEAYLSEAAIVARLAERGISLRTLSDVGAAAERGDDAVLELLDETGELLGGACADLIHLVSPQQIVLGGNLTLVAPYLLAGLHRVLAERALAAPLERCRVVLSPLGVESVTMGGVALAMEGFLGLPAWLAASEIGAALP
jgi:predicted NBD/HSP70 family sugar kinase